MGAKGNRSRQHDCNSIIIDPYTGFQFSCEKKLGHEDKVHQSTVQWYGSDKGTEAFHRSGDSVYTFTDVVEDELAAAKARRRP